MRKDTRKTPKRREELGYNRKSRDSKGRQECMEIKEEFAFGRRCKKKTDKMRDEEKSDRENRRQEV